MKMNLYYKKDNSSLTSVIATDEPETNSIMEQNNDLSITIGNNGDVQTEV